MFPILPFDTVRTGLHSYGGGTSWLYPGVLVVPPDTLPDQPPEPAILIEGGGFKVFGQIVGLLGSDAVQFSVQQR